MNEDKNNHTDEGREGELCYEQNQDNNNLNGEDNNEQEPSTSTNRKVEKYRTVT